MNALLGCRVVILGLVVLFATTERAIANAEPTGQQEKPNILVIWGDDIGWFNPSAYHRGMMGYETPNIDRIAREGLLFTAAYGQQSCTAGRAAFLTGQNPVRTGLTKVGLPGADLGLRAEDPTLAELLKPHGYVTGQFGKNHLGDRNEFLPTVHGFDEFFGNLYHLNAEEEPENVDYPKDPAFKERFGPRGVLHSFATEEEDSTVEPRWGPVGKQEIEDTGPLTRKRMETVDQEFLEASLEFIDNAHENEKPFLVWFNSTRMHIFTHLKEESEGKTGQGIYADGMVEHDGHVGQLLDKLDELGIADNTIVIYSTDNGAEVFSWPDGGTTPFRGEKATCWEGGFRVPQMIRWPGKIPAGTVSNGIISHEDWVPTLLAAVGEPDIKEKLLEGHEADGKSFKVHLDGFDQTEMLTGEGPTKRESMFYFNDDGALCALRYNDYKIHFLEQRADGFGVWQESFVPLRFPKLFNLRMDPFERAEEAMDYAHWRVERMYVAVPAQTYVAEFLETFRDFPPRQRPSSFNLDEVMEKLKQNPSASQ